MSDDGDTHIGRETAADRPERADHGAIGSADSLAGGVVGVVDVEIQTEMEQSFLDYAMSVITSRALPDARDGLKPVHRRILWSMFDTGLRPNRPHKKCATVVGDVIANYHPHGDSSIYDALVRMGQSFSLANTLIDPHGNFGSPSDPPAAYRYTECRLTDLAMTMAEGIDEETVDFASNFDGSRTEPLVMPSRFPNLLVNGSQGIAVGMATNIPTHNLGEIIDATVHLIQNPEATVDDLMGFVRGPDFPTGGRMLGRAGAREAMATGRGSVKLRARAEIVTNGKRSSIVVSEIPYQASIENIERKIADAVNRKVIEGITELRNESAKGKTRFVIELRPSAPANVVLNNLWKHTPLQSSFAVNMVALVDGVPRTLNLRDALAAYVDHQIEVVTRRSQHRLDEARARAHIVEGLLRALDLIDEIIALIRASDDRAAALEGLCAEPMSFSAEQANHILDMQLSRLTRLGRTRLIDELAELRGAIAELEAILGSDARLRRVIVGELSALRDEHQTPRRTEIVTDPGEMDAEDLIEDEPLVVTLTREGYVKATSPDVFRTQGRGGRGVQGARLKDDDVVVRVLLTTAHAWLLCFTNRGRVHRLKAYEVPLTSRTARGTAFVNLLQLGADERVEAVVEAREFPADRYLMFVTRNGLAKKTPLSAYENIRSNGLIALSLRDGDELVRVLETSGEDDVLIVSRAGQAIRFAETPDVRSMGRNAAGVRAMRLRDGDTVAAADVLSADDSRSLLLVTSSGAAKRTEADRFPRKGRGGLGVIAVKLPEADAQVVGARLVEAEDEVMLVSSGGVLIRTRVSDISQQERMATGVRAMALDDDEAVVAIALVELPDIPENDHPVGESRENAVGEVTSAT
ncbi:DNA gyrase subunit A [Candidatus Poriferisodalis sp.]|uniref:DNA gyrase subunit A n=1 Tax=Candidatus Poriferisodalis sp. TaxID=3101277 RepID=UPI003B029D59